MSLKCHEIKEKSSYFHMFFFPTQKAWTFSKMDGKTIKHSDKIVVLY